MPADAIALTVQAPAGAYSVLRYASGALFALVAPGGAFAVYLVTRSREQRRASAESRAP